MKYIIAFVLLIIIASPVSAQTALRGAWHFNTGVTPVPGILHKSECSSRWTPTTDARAGGMAMKFEVAPPDGVDLATCTTKNRLRTELLPNYAPPYNIPDGSMYRWNDGKSHWIGLAVKPIVMPGEIYSLMQIHAPTLEGPNPACVLTKNALTLTIMKIDGVLNYIVYGLVAPTPRDPGVGGAVGGDILFTQPVQPNVWVDFVFNFTLSTNGQGYFKVWRNGVLVANVQNISNVYSVDSCGNPVPANKYRDAGPHFGIYGPPTYASSSYVENRFSKNLNRVVIFDEVRTATGPDGYWIVSPATYAPAGASQ